MKVSDALDVDLPGWPSRWSDDRQYRYTLWRRWGVHPDSDDFSWVNFICLNPSTADEHQDDPTVRRCVYFADEWGYDAVCVTNLFAYRATDPDDLKAADDPVGPENTLWIDRVADQADLIVAAWGANGSYRGRSARIRESIMFDRQLWCLTETESGEPGHPLYLPRKLIPRKYKNPWGEEAPQRDCTYVVHEVDCPYCEMLDGVRGTWNELVDYTNLVCEGDCTVEIKEG